MVRIDLKELIFYYIGSDINLITIFLNDV